jgi:hypothetical protein
VSTAVQVVCNGVEVMTIGGTKAVYNVDIYSGNHPFYQGSRTTMVRWTVQLWSAVSPAAVPCTRINKHDRSLADP